jgi:hypothetical protein
MHTYTHTYVHRYVYIHTYIRGSRKRQRDKFTKELKHLFNIQTSQGIYTYQALEFRKKQPSACSSETQFVTYAFFVPCMHTFVCVYIYTHIYRCVCIYIHTHDIQTDDTSSACSLSTTEIYTSTYVYTYMTHTKKNQCLQHLQHFISLNMHTSTSTYMYTHVI